MTALIDLECLRPVTVLSVLTGHAPPEQLGLCTSHPKKFQAALLRLRNRSSMVHSRLLSVAILAWSLYQVFKAILTRKQYSYFATIAMYAVPQLTMFAKLWIDGGNHEMRLVFSKLTEVDELLIKSRDGRPVFWIKCSCRYASFIVIFYLYNSLLYVYSVLQIVSSHNPHVDAIIVIVLHVLSNVTMLEFMSVVSLIKNRFDVLNSLIAEFSYIPNDGTSNNVTFKSDNIRHQSLSTNSHGELGERNPEGVWSRMFHLRSHTDSHRENKSLDDSRVGEDTHKNNNLSVKLETIYNNHIGSVEYPRKSFAFQPQKNSTVVVHCESDSINHDDGRPNKTSLEPDVVKHQNEEICKLPWNLKNTQHNQVGIPCVLEEYSERKLSLGREDIKIQRNYTEPSCRFELFQEHDLTMNIISVLSKRLGTLRLAHHTLHEVSHLVNRHYGIFLLSEVCAVFVVLVVCAHIVLNLQTLSRMAGPFTVSSMAIWITVTVTRIIMMIFCCRGVSEEASKTVSLVAKPRVSPAIQSLWDVYSLQLVHCGCFQFNAGGVFRMEIQLLFSIVGATATYLIVLQQYNDLKI